MSISSLSIILFSVMFTDPPFFSLGELSSWLCETCTVCQSCLPCEPHLNISPKCECQKKHNNCSCKRITHKNHREYKKQWNFRLMDNQQNHRATKMNSHQVQRHLLLWLVGLSFFNIFVLIVIIILVIFAPVLVRRCVVWKAKCQAKRRNRLMKKLSLVESSPCRDIAFESSLSVPTLSSVVSQSIPILKPSYTNPSHQSEAQKKLVIDRVRDLKTEHDQTNFNISSFLRIR